MKELGAPFKGPNVNVCHGAEKAPLEEAAAQTVQVTRSPTFQNPGRYLPLIVLYRFRVGS